MNIRIVSALLLISALFLSSSDCLPIYLHGHTLRKILIPGLIGASAIGFTGYGVALAASAKKFKDIGDHDKDDHDDDDKKWPFSEHKILKIKLDKDHKIHDWEFD